VGSKTHRAGPRSSNCRPIQDGFARGEDMMTIFPTRFIQSESGATLVEYSLLIALISIALVTTFSALTGSLYEFFDILETYLKIDT